MLKDWIASIQSLLNYVILTDESVAHSLKPQLFMAEKGLEPVPVKNEIESVGFCNLMMI